MNGPLSKLRAFYSGKKFKSIGILNAIPALFGEIILNNSYWN
jgi:hypothetical protein